MVDDQQIGVAPPSMPLTPPPFSSPQSSNRAREESLHAVIISLNTAVGGYVLFQFQHKNLSLFHEHGIIMRAVFVMQFFYVMGIIAEFKLQIQSRFLNIMKQFTPLFGLLAVVLLLFILSLPLGFATSIIWAYLVVGPTISLSQEIIQCLHVIIVPLCTNQRETRDIDMEESDPMGTEENDLLVEASFDRSINLSG